MQKSFFRFLSWRKLRIQVILICLVTLIIALGGLTMLNVKQQEKRLLRLSLSEANALAKNTAGTIVEWILNEDFDKLSEASLRAADFSRVISIQILNAEGFPVATVNRDEAGLPQEVFASEQLELPSEASALQIQNEDHIVSWAPVVAEGTIGWVRLDYSLEELLRIREELWQRGLTFLSLFFALSITVFWKFFDRPLKAIERITEFASQMADTEIEPLVVDATTHETEKLAHTLNQTSKRLHDNMLALEEAKSELEARVERRTHDLAESVSQLKHEMAERKRVEEQLLHTQKMESIGQLAAGVAHEINTPIQFVSDNLQFINDSRDDLFEIIEHTKSLIDELEKGQDAVESKTQKLKAVMEENDLDYLEEELPSAIEQSLEGTQRISKIVQAMKTFSHPSSDEMEVIDLNQAIKTTATLTSNEWKYVADLEFDFYADLKSITCAPGELNQVVLNLIVNASHAIEDANKARNESKGKITISTLQLDDEWVQIDVADTGMGIPSSAQSKIFDPFFTTKTVGKGTGQGLSISYDVVVNKHQGELSFDTEEGVGTTFHIRIPVNPPKNKRPVCLIK